MDNIAKITAFTKIYKYNTAPQKSSPLTFDYYTRISKQYIIQPDTIYHS